MESVLQNCDDNYIYTRSQGALQISTPDKSPQNRFAKKNRLNLKFLHIFHVEKFEIPPNLATFLISPHLLCAKSEIPLHVENFRIYHNWHIHMTDFFLQLYIGDKYEVCMGSFQWICFFVTRSWREMSLPENIMQSLCERENPILTRTWDIVNVLIFGCMYLSPKRSAYRRGIISFAWFIPHLCLFFLQCSFMQQSGKRRR